MSQIAGVVGIAIFALSNLSFICDGHPFSGRAQKVGTLYARTLSGSGAGYAILFRTVRAHPAGGTNRARTRIHQVLVPAPPVSSSQEDAD